MILPGSCQRSEILPKPLQKRYNLGMLFVEDGNSYLEMRVVILVRSNYAPWTRNDHTGFEVMLGIWRRSHPLKKPQEMPEILDMIFVRLRNLRAVPWSECFRLSL